MIFFPQSVKHSSWVGLVACKYFLKFQFFPPKKGGQLMQQLTEFLLIKCGGESLAVLGLFPLSFLQICIEVLSVCLVNF